MKYPGIYLAIDNCFAYKRWTKPEEWCRVIADLGISYVEASADTELDPLFMGKEYLADWVGSVKKSAKDNNISIATLFSGHGTYTTLGLTHTDPRVRRRMMDNWFKPMIEITGELKAGLGFYAHAFPHYVLQDPSLYREWIGILKQELIELNAYGVSRGCKFLALEQMYTPHQYPWTIQQTKELISEVSASSGTPFYFTEDLGHHQVKFVIPDDASLEKACRHLEKNIWLGSDFAYELAERGDVNALKTDINKNLHLFAEPGDGDCYSWILNLGKYSPIIHLQQTNGRSSEHLPFTRENNEKGIINGEKVFQTLKEAYAAPDEKGLKSCENIYLILELFAGTSAITHDLLRDIKESVSYWRQWIPRDGMALDEITA
jgi:sugar phosphate isomerase/epimerase